MPLLLCFVFLGGANPGWAKTRIVVLGDSLTEGYNISKEAAFPALLEKEFRAQGREVEIVNAGISGSTSASLEGRLRWHLKNKPDFLMIALGANDGLRGFPVKETRKNLRTAIQAARKAGIQVILVGMKLPPNYGRKYAEDFAKIFPELAAEEKVALIPFLLEGVAGDRQLNLEDGIHPNEKGHRIIAQKVYERLSRIVK